jgi:CHAD domain-containing protein
VRRFVEAAQRNLPEVAPWGTGKATRDFIYAGDAAEAFLRAAELYDRSEVVNVSSGFDTSIWQVVDLLAWVRTERHAACDRAAAVLSDSAHALRLLAFTRAVLSLQPADPPAGTPWSDSGLARWAHDALRKGHADLRREAREARRLGPEGRHELRIALKKLRYSQEFLGSLLPPKRLARSTAALADAQALLGGLNDLSTAQGLLAHAPATLAPSVVAALLTGLQQRLDTGLQALPAMEEALEQTSTPWR